MTANKTLTCPDQVSWCAEHIENHSDGQIFYAHSSAPVSVGLRHPATANLEKVGLRYRRAPWHPAGIAVVGGTLTPAEARQFAAALTELADLAERDTG